eukprot:1157771-Pelagomonas_calceolata.AAC.3
MLVLFLFVLSNNEYRQSSGPRTASALHRSDAAWLPPSPPGSRQLPPDRCWLADWPTTPLLPAMASSQPF